MGPANTTTNSLGLRLATLFALSVLLNPHGQAKGASDWKDNLKDSLEKTYPLTHRATMSPDRITQQGVVLVIRKEGIAADPSSDARFSTTYVTDGQLSEQGGATVAFFGKRNTRVFKPGEKVYVIDIKVGDDYVMLELLSCDMFDFTQRGSTRQTRYKSALSFKFDKGLLPELDPEKIKATISSVVSTESEAAAQNTKTISLGQTPEQVKAILGEPEKIVNLGPKVTYVYKDMKVVFQDGKVADVQ